MGSSPRRKISLLGIAHPVVGKPFQVLEVHRATRLTQDPSREEKGWKCLVLKFCDFWVGNIHRDDDLGRVSRADFWVHHKFFQYMEQKCCI